MKFLIASDLHGSAYYCTKLLDAFTREGADRIIMLGDILYHGPRNDLPRDYAPKEVIQKLNQLSDIMLCVRGNCDTEVDQMVLDFPIMADYMLLPVGEHLVYATHGHIFNKDNMPPLKNGDVLLHGHTHIPTLDRENNVYIINPGSLSIPKNGSVHGYMTLEDGVFTHKDIDGEIIGRLDIEY